MKDHIMTDQNLAFLNQFIRLYQDLMAHDGYGDIEVNIRLFKREKKEVILRCGKEFRYRIPIPESGLLPDYCAVAETDLTRADLTRADLTRAHLTRAHLTGADSSEDGRSQYTGPERRTGKDRRNYTRNRRTKDVPRNFRLERRVLPDRRAGRGRRTQDQPAAPPL